MDGGGGLPILRLEKPVRYRAGDHMVGMFQATAPGAEMSKIASKSAVLIVNVEPLLLESRS